MPLNPKPAAHHQVPIEQPEGEPAKPTKLAIGTDGGFQVGSPTWREEATWAVVAVPSFTRVELPCDELPTIVTQSVDAVQVMGAGVGDGGRDGGVGGV